MRLRNARRITQAFFFALFLFLIAMADLRWLGGYPASLFLELDPLVGIATAISAHEVYRGVLWGLAIIIPTLILGRFFCGWICPFGAMHQATGWLLGHGRRPPRARAEVNHYRPIYRLKYWILAFMLGAAIFGSLQIGWLDPIALLHRSFAGAVLPAANAASPVKFFATPHVAAGAWLIGGILIALLAANLIIPRFFCRALCPLGALMGVPSKLSLARIDRNPDHCNGCGLCLANCEGACDPHADLRKSECHLCFNCIEDCPHGSLSLRFLPEGGREVAAPDAGGRRAVLAGLAGLAVFGFARAGGRTADPSLIRPPGSLDEPEFLARCLKCDQCLRVCPTGVLQPAGFQAGLEGIWTPLLDMRTGYCELNCTLCGQVCPTGAIQRITIEEKLGLGERAEHGPVRIGTAFFDRGRCLPWAMDTPCVVCQEVCPVSPKAIYTRDITLTRRDGTNVELHRPYIDPALCIGCGICQHECPVRDLPAVRVTAIGETRTPSHSLLMATAGTQPE